MSNREHRMSKGRGRKKSGLRLRQGFAGQVGSTKFALLTHHASIPISSRTQLTRAGSIGTTLTLREHVVHTRIAVSYTRVTRREWLKRTAAVAGAPLVIRASAMGAGGHTPPSDRVVMGCIGTGGRGRVKLRGLMTYGAKVVAVCDVDAAQRARANTASAASGPPGRKVAP